MIATRPFGCPSNRSSAGVALGPSLSNDDVSTTVPSDLTAPSRLRFRAHSVPVVRGF
jgi:hypothetical protein